MSTPTASRVDAEPTPPPQLDWQPLPIHFSGSGSEYFRIWVVNLLLVIYVPIVDDLPVDDIGICRSWWKYAEPLPRNINCKCVYCAGKTHAFINPQYRFQQLEGLSQSTPPSRQTLKVVWGHLSIWLKDSLFELP